MIEEQFGKEQEYSWIVVRSDKGPLNRKELEDYQLDTELMEYALDKNERAHMEYDGEADRLLLIFNPNYSYPEYLCVTIKKIIRNKQ
ncbi:hypothetical protein [Streptococcus sp. NLN64]|uniref:hypothetical protein n=1 Tax=Streptococcus sp. NLN64 TaxID=2822799 RepID=UPI0018CB9796|nr:hypothetical protein [Streptococcus sp. NLN64]MBG9368227.1 hypothetical protein [Streptococcus sp. NLN64]